jgi:hypothetical protein
MKGLDGISPHARKIAQLMDEGIPIAGGRFKVPLDPVIGLIPGIGDAVTFMIASGVVAEAARQGAPKLLLARMTANIVFDLALGTVPVVGDVGDFFFRANRRNLRLLEKHLARAGNAAGPGPGGNTAS